MAKLLHCVSCGKNTNEINIIKFNDEFQREQVKCPKCKSVQLKPNFIESE